MEAKPALGDKLIRDKLTSVPTDKHGGLIVVCIVVSLCPEERQSSVVFVLRSSGSGGRLNDPTQAMRYGSYLTK